MRINLVTKSMDMEERDFIYMLGSYTRTYLMGSKNEDPVEILFPMFRSIPHPTKKGVTIPVHYVPAMSPEALDIANDGKDIPITTQVDEVKADEKDKILGETVQVVKELQKIYNVDTGQPPAQRIPRQPEHPAVGSPDNMGSRIADDNVTVAKDLDSGSGEPGGESKPFDKKIGRDADGNPIIVD